VRSTRFGKPDKAFDDPEVIDRHRRLLDSVFDRFGQLDLIGFGIGVEKKICEICEICVYILGYLMVDGFIIHL
jgi:hypothetical protein